MTKPNWKVQHFNGDGEFELTVIRSDNTHGQISWGWTGLQNKKFLIAKGAAEDHSRADMKEMVRVAALIADLFNREGL